MYVSLKIILISILFMMTPSCSNNTKRIEKHNIISKYVSQNFDQYSTIHSEVNEIIKEMIKYKQKSIIDQIGHDYQIDSLMIFTKDQTKLYTTINTNFKEYRGSNDMVQSLYGVKIGGKWHVYLGNQNLIAMRDGYKTNKYEPFTWEELSYVAHEQMFGRYLIYSESELTINYQNLEHDTSVRSLTGKNLEEVESEEAAFIELTEYYNSKKLDSTEYQQLLNEINNPEPKERDPIKKLTWWDKLWGEEVPVFDSKEWKEYIANKNKGK